MHSITIGLTAVILCATSLVAETTLSEPCPEQAHADQCLTCAVYHEARGEDLTGQVAVALVLFNRMESSRYPDTMCGVVWQKGYSRVAGRMIGQLSFTTDGASDMMHETDAIHRAEAASEMAKVIYDYDLEYEFNGMNKDILWYHTTAVHPSWADVYTRVVGIGNHLFYQDDT